MNVKETLKAATGSLLLNKVRSFLTMLGVIIGVFAVISLVSLVGGMKNYIKDQFEGLGSNLLFVVGGKIDMNQGQGFNTAMMNSSLKEKHADTIRTFAKDYVDTVSPEIQLSKTVKYKTQGYYVSLFGTGYDSTKIYNSTVEKGRYFTRAEQNSSSRVVVLGNLLSNKLFGDASPINKVIKIDNKSFEVLGVLNKKGPDFDESIVIPYTTLIDTFERANITAITVKAKNNVDFSEAKKQVELALLRDLSDDEFTVYTQEDILSSVNSILSILTSVLVAISGISLVVGGIGIMNIMLVSVTERTREIGLRKALGATSKDIKRQFMIEAVMISSLGGLIGLFLGWLGIFATRSFTHANISLWSVFLALGFSLFVGVVFGTYPAAKASEKDPIEALRYE
jgi:putative ABC transport system permease protein